METLQSNLPIIVIDALDQEKKNEKLLRKLSYYGFTKVERESFLENGFFFKPYDFTPELREQHDRELSEWREERDRTLRISLHITLNPNLSLAEKWREIEDTYPLTPDSRIFYFGERLEEKINSKYLRWLFPSHKCLPQPRNH